MIRSNRWRMEIWAGASIPSLQTGFLTEPIKWIWEAKPGGVQAVMSSDDLRSSSHWVANSTQAINYVTNEWVDPVGFLEQARFYRIDKIQ
jgi:hypothetical protein